MRFVLFLCALAFSTSANADGYGFMTPSGNIYCNGSIDGGISCTIVSKNGTPPAPRPQSCGAYWGHTFEVGHSGPARMLCDSSPEQVDYSDIASYGLTGEFGAITCKSERTGLTCRNKSGHGFFLSRRKQSLF